MQSQTPAFLDFCLSNVYEYTSEDARAIARAMLSVPGKHAQPTLSYLTELEADAFQLALQSLWSANVVSMTNVATETGYVTVYELNELPRLYILRNHPPTASEISRYQSRRREINAMHEMLQANRNKDRYDLSYITRRTNDDTVLSKYLSDALAVSKKNLSAAADYVEKAKKLDPSFFEVHRVEAIVNRWAGNHAAAWEAYENAIACEPKHAPLRYWYGGFLLRDNSDVDAAHEQFQLAAEIDPESPQVRLELGRTYVFKGEFELADDHISPIVSNQSATLKLRRKAFDTWLQSASRRAIQCFENGDYVGSLDAYEEQVKRYNEFASTLADERIIMTMIRQSASVDILLNVLGQTTEAERAKDILFSLSTIHADNSLSTIETRHVSNQEIGPDDVGRRFTGVVLNYDPTKRYGFIEFDAEKRIFFHQSDVTTAGCTIKPGISFSFLVTSRDEKYRAADITLEDYIIVDQPSEIEHEDIVSDEVQKGIIKSILFDKRFGFIYTDAGEDVFFHVNNLSDGIKLRDLHLGDRVSFVIGQNDKGKVADRVKID